MPRVKAAVSGKRALPARQARSRRTQDRLLEAAEAVMAERGLEAATVPEIAARAGLSVGVVYRRFPDKDALMRAVYERVFERIRTLNRTHLDPARWAGQSLPELARALVHGMTGSYRAHAPLLRSLLLYRLTHRDARFRNQSERLDREAFALYGRLMEERRGEISHPLREEAAKFALLAVTLVLQGMVLAGRERFDRHAPPPEQLGAELTRLFLGYLGPHEPPVKRRRVRTL